MYPFVYFESGGFTITFIAAWLIADKLFPLQMNIHVISQLSFAKEGFSSPRMRALVRFIFKVNPNVRKKLVKIIKSFQATFRGSAVLACIDF